MINCLNIILQLKRVLISLYHNLFTHFAALAIIFVFSEYSAAYFQELDRLTNEHLVGGVDFVITQDDRYFVVATGGKNSTLQTYRLADLKSNKFPEMVAISTLKAGYKERKLTGLGVLLYMENDHIFTVSEGSYEREYGCILSSFKVSENGTLNPVSELPIMNPNQTSYNKKVSGSGNKLFVICENILASISINLYTYTLTLIDIVNMTYNVIYPSALLHDQKFNRLFLIYSSLGSEKTEVRHDIVRTYDIDQKGSLNNPSIVKQELDAKGEFYTLAFLFLAKYLVIYEYESDSKNFISIQIQPIPIPNMEDSVQLKIDDFIINQRGNRLYYTSQKFRLNPRNQLGAFSVDMEGNVEMILSTIDVTNLYNKLALLSDNCHLLAMADGVKNKMNGTMVLYRINDPEIDCVPPKQKTVLEATISSTLGLIMLSTTIMVSTYFFCVWLRKRGAKKGYMPIGNIDY